MAQSWWQWLRGWWNNGTLGGLSRLYDKISKIRARQCTRNEQDSNFHLGRTDADATRGRPAVKRSLDFLPMRSGTTPYRYPPARWRDRRTMSQRHRHSPSVAQHTSRQKASIYQRKTATTSRGAGGLVGGSAPEVQNP